MTEAKRKKDIMLWLNGWGMPGQAIAPLRAALHDFEHVMAPYNQGETPEEMLSIASETVRNLRSAAGGGRILIAGWSLGGLLGQRIAVDGFADGLVLLASTARFVRSGEQADRGWPERSIHGMIAALSRDSRAVLLKFHRNLFTEREWKAGLGGRIPLDGGWSASSLVAGLHILIQENLLPRLADIACPVYLVHGTEDAICPYGAAEELAALVPGATMHPIDGAGHAPFLGREADIAGHIGRWWHEQQRGRN